MISRYKKHGGFSLVEMAVVLVILGFVISALMLPVTAQREVGFLRQTETQLEVAQKALIGFAQANGRLPCPATNESAGVESPVGGGICERLVGLLPATTLGIKPINDRKQAIDGWGNPIFYAVTQFDNPKGLDIFPGNEFGIKNAPDFTTSGELGRIGISKTEIIDGKTVLSLRPDLVVLCANVPTDQCPANNQTLINNAVAVVYSLGSTGAQVLAGAATGGADEQANRNNDNVFVSHDIRVNDPNGSFNHIVTWISPYVLYNAMIQAGQLP
ncbi:type II secretion system protein [Methylobacillus pratensis]